MQAREPKKEALDTVCSANDPGALSAEGGCAMDCAVGTAAGENPAHPAARPRNNMDVIMGAAMSRSVRSY